MTWNKDAEYYVSDLKVREYIRTEIYVYTYLLRRVLKVTTLPARNSDYTSYMMVPCCSMAKKNTSDVLE